MKPDRSNYEIWFTDWLDGNLGKEQVEELKIFLKENPDLNEELNGLDLVTLNAPDLTFSGKAGLGKSPGSISDSEFDYLCIASLENDLTTGQKAELEEIIGRDEMKRKTFELIQKLRLKPLQAGFPRKSIIKKLTTGRKILRLSIVGLSAAATIAVIIFIYRLNPSNIKSESPPAAQNIDTFLIEPGRAYVIKTPEFNTRNSIRPVISKTITESFVSENNVPLAEQAEREEQDSASVFQRPEALIMLKVPVPENIITEFNRPANVIIPYTPSYVPPLIDYRSNVQIFLARIFHEKIMKDTNSGTRPVESYEIAQAGIKSVNKLFGWKLALHRNTGENGEIRSYNFSSRLLKFNAPVKKSVKEL
jgi:uncharacterized protein YbcI